MVLVFGASTSLGAPHNTSYFIRPLLFWLDPRMSEETFEHWHFIIRKTAHFVEYAVLGLLAWRAVYKDPAFQSFSEGRQFRFALLLAALYASTDEFHQKFVPEREAAVRDVMLDTSGAGAGLLVLWCGRRWCRAKAK
jgi:VanZ family protein